MSWTVKAENHDGSSTQAFIDTLPDECPQCHRKAAFSTHSAYMNSRVNDAHRLEIIFRCPSSECREVFIGYYAEVGIASNTYRYHSGRPASYLEREFTSTIMEISPDFSIIYNEALTAENLGLAQICGAGYRKAVEFLVKDYLLAGITDAAVIESVKKEALGSCIANRIEEPTIKAVAKRAVWLGNDETHYSRKWEEKDLTDLKKLIDLTVHWMEMAALTSQLLKDMPEEPKDTSTSKEKSVDKAPAPEPSKNEQQAS